MIEIVERSPIPASPERVWDWFTFIDRHYLQWHPEHIAWRNIKGRYTQNSAVVFFDENIGKFRLPMRCRVAETVPGRYLRYEGTFPFSLIGAGGWFEIIPNGDQCILVAEVHIGWASFLSPLVDRAIAIFFPLNELRRHMREEGVNLANILGNHRDGIPQSGPDERVSLRT